MRWPLFLPLGMAGGAALAATVGLDEPFLWLMGKSLEVVMAIAHYSAETSPDIDVPWLDSIGMALAAAAIALFCVLARRGRVLAVIPAAAAVAVWLTSPQAVVYIANDGAVFLPQEKAWIELTDWRAENGRDPLIIGDAKKKSPCPGKGQACELKLSTGNASIEPAAGAAIELSPTTSQLLMRLNPSAAAIEIDP